MDPEVQTNVNTNGPTNTVETSHMSAHLHKENSSSTSDAREPKVSTLPTSVDILPTEDRHRKAESSQDKEAKRPDCSCPWDSDDDSDSSSDEADSENETSSDDDKYHFTGAVPRGEWNCRHQHKHKHGKEQEKRKENRKSKKARQHAQGCPYFRGGEC